MTVLIVSSLIITLISFYWYKDVIEKLNIFFDKKSCCLHVPAGVIIQSFEIHRKNSRASNSYDINVEGSIYLCKLINIEELKDCALWLYVQRNDHHYIYRVIIPDNDNQQTLEAEEVTASVEYSQWRHNELCTTSALMPAPSGTVVSCNGIIDSVHLPCARLPIANRPYL